MKFKIEKSANKDIDYPCLMESISERNLVILFTDPNTGVCVYSCFLQGGVIRSDLDLANFKPFNGKITLSND